MDSGGDHDCFDPHVLHPLPKSSAVDTVPIAQEIAWRSCPRERVDHLLRCPLCRRMFRNVDMHDTASFMGQDEQHEEYVVGHRWHDKEIQRDQILHMVVKKGLPRW